MPLIFPCLCSFCRECALNEEAKAQQQQQHVDAASAGATDKDGRPTKKRAVTNEDTPTPCMNCGQLSTIPVAEL